MTSGPHAHHHHEHADVDARIRQRWLAAEWTFVSSALPPAPARLVEIGCGSAGGLVPAAVRAGYEAIGVDPQAPDGPDYRQLPFEEYESHAPLDAVMSVQALHHLPDLDAAFERIARMLVPGGVLVVVEWAWERLDEATARWLFERAPEASTGWARERRADWTASGLPWPEYRDQWARGHGLHSWQAVEAALGKRFDTVHREDVPALFGDFAEIDEDSERTAIDAGEIAATGVHWVGRARRAAHFFCTLVHGDAWDDARGIREQDGWDEHAAFMDGLVADGFIVVGGPVGTGDYTAHLVESDSEETVRARLAEDPWARDGHLVVGVLEPWSLWLDGR